MKRYLYIILLFAFAKNVQLFAGEITNIDWGEATNTVQMSISLEGGAREINTNGTCDLVVCLKTDSKDVFFALVTSGTTTDVSDGLSCIVISPSGKDISPANNSNSFGSANMLNIRSGKIETFKFNLGSVCSFNEVGTYKVIAKKAIGSPSVKSPFVVISNTLLVSVIPKR